MSKEKHPKKSERDDGNQYKYTSNYKKVNGLNATVKREL